MMVFNSNRKEHHSNRNIIFLALTVLVVSGGSLVQAGGVVKSGSSQINAPDRIFSYSSGTGPQRSTVAQIATDGDNNVYVAGTTLRGLSWYDILLTKYDSTGAEQWVRYYDRGLNDEATDLHLSGSGRLLLTGTSDTVEGGSRILTANYDLNGNRLWEVVYADSAGGDYFGRIITGDDAGNVYVVGVSTYPADLITIKYDSNGTQEWVSRHASGNFYEYNVEPSIQVDASGDVWVATTQVAVRYNSSGAEMLSLEHPGDLNEITAMKLDDAGNAYFLGPITEAGGYTDFGIVKIDPGAALFWSVPAGLPGQNDIPRAFQIDAHQNVLVATGGETGGMFIWKFSAEGDYQWVQVYVSNAGRMSLLLSSTGDFYVSGATGTGSVLMKYDSSGVELWSRTSLASGPSGRPPVMCLDQRDRLNLSGVVQAHMPISYFSTEITTRQYNPQGTLVWEKNTATVNSFDFLTDMTVDQEGNVYATGQSLDPVSSYDYVTVKFDNEGVRQWVARYAGPDSVEDTPVGIVVDDSGNVYVGGSTGAGHQADFLIVKYSPSGEQQWTKMYDGPGNGRDVPAALKLDREGNILITGSSDGQYGGTYQDIATVKYNPSGDLLWVTRYTGPENDSDEGTAVGLATDDSGNVFVSGWARSGPGNIDYLTFKYNSLGAEQWMRTYDDSVHSYTIPRAMTVDDSGNVYVTGDVVLSGGQSMFVTVKYSNEGVLQWLGKYQGGAGFNRPVAIAVGLTGEVYVTGVSEGAYPNGMDYATVKYTAAGIMEWGVRDSISPSSLDYPAGIVVAPNGNVIVTGSSSVYSAGVDVLTVQYGPGGERLERRVYAGPGGSDDQAIKVVYGTAGDLYVGGSMGGGSEWNAYVILKYNDNIVGVLEDDGRLPARFSLLSNYPNPFNPVTTVEYVIERPTAVRLSVFSLLGQEVEVLVDEYRHPGTYKIKWDADRFSSGIYFIRLLAGSVAATAKMILMK